MLGAKLPSVGFRVNTLLLSPRKSREKWYRIPKSNTPLNLVLLEGILYPVGNSKRELHVDK